MLPHLVAYSILLGLSGCKPEASKVTEDFKSVFNQETLQAPAVPSASEELAKTEARINYAAALDAAYKKAAVQIEVKTIAGRFCHSEEHRTLDLYSPLIFDPTDMAVEVFDISPRVLLAAREVTQADLADALRRLDFYGIRIRGRKYDETHYLRDDRGCE
jgi:hypothetical protein